MLRYDDRGFAGRLLGTALVGLAVAGLAACQDLSANSDQAEVSAVEKGINLDPEAVRERMLAVAIPVGDDLYMVPTGLDEDGCETFNPFSVNNPVKTAVHYRQADGSFGIARDPAVCKVEMVAIDPDEDGCARYQAAPLNADLPVEHDVVYYMTTDGTYSAHKPKTSCPDA